MSSQSMRIMRRDGIVGLMLTLTTVLAATLVVYFGAPPAPTAPRPSGLSFRPAQIIDSFGALADLDQARSTGLLSLPTYLPGGTTLSEVRMRARGDDGFGDGVALIYANPNMPRIPYYNGDIQIIVWILNDGTTFSPPATLVTDPEMTIEEGGVTRTVVTASTRTIVPRAHVVQVGTVPGWGYGPAELAYGHDTGALEWWSNGLHYGVNADLPLSELLKIAESMG